MEFKDVVYKRTSIRKYSNKPVEKEKINYVLECARWAPSTANRQCWQFIVVTNKEKIRDLTKASSVINRWLKDAPTVIVACGNPNESGVHNGISYYPVDVAVAMEHLVLAATDKKLGTCWIAAFNEEKVKEILGIPSEIRVIALTPLGYPERDEGLWGKSVKTIIGSKKRKDLDEIVHYDDW